MVFKNLLSKSRVIDIQSCLPDGIVLITKNGIVQWANDLAAEKFLQKPSIINTPLDDYLEGGLKTVLSVISTNTAGVAKLVDKDEYVEITVKEIPDAYVVSMRDTTQKYKTVNSIIEEHQNSKKVNTDKNAFLLKLSNDFKSPIHSIIGFSQAILDGMGGKVTKKQDKYLKIINKSSSDLLYLFDKLIELSETESDSFEKDVRFFDVATAINSIIKINEQLYTERQVEIKFDLAENTTKKICADEKAFKSMFNTLLETIIRSMDLGTINVSMSIPDKEYLASHDIAEDKSALLITLASTNNAILETELPTLFNPYAVIDKSNKKNVTRSMALACVKNILNYMNASIWVETMPLQGVVFNILLPFEKDINE